MTSAGPLSLFAIPDAAMTVSAPAHDIPAGGIGTGHFVYTAAGDFRHWRMQPEASETDRTVATDRFHVWVERAGRTAAVPAAMLAGVRRRLFPLTWDDYAPSHEVPVRLASLSFSPLVPGGAMEASLPVYVVAWRAHNPTDRPLQVALMLTWECAWPARVPDAAFDFQHDNLCLTGSLGSPSSAERVGIALPDLHSQGIYLQGIEPWHVPGGLAAIEEDFAEDGELDPAGRTERPHGAAAWVKFDLRPGETKEAPFVIGWHMPLYEAGPEAGRPRQYTHHLGKRRPDNAIVWLAEQAVEDYGAETATYRYWAQHIADWHEDVLSAAPDVEQALARVASAAALVEADVSWTDEGCFSVAGGDPGVLARLHDARIAELWPELRPHTSGG